MFDQREKSFLDPSHLLGMTAPRLTEEKFKTFTPKEICDAKKDTEVLVRLSTERRLTNARRCSHEVYG
jgi:hypothetical protein